MKLGPFEVKLHDDWKDSWKWFHVQANVLLGFATAAYGYWDDMQTYLSPGWFHAGQMMLIGAIIFNAFRAK